MKRAPKPRISKPRLHWVWRDGWVPLHRTTWTEGGKRKERTVTLEWEGDAKKLDEEYWRCESGRHEKQSRPTRYTWSALIESWRGDPRVQRKLKPGTKRSYANDMNAILEKNAGKDVRKTTRQGVRKIHEALSATPRKADKRITTIKLLWNYGRHMLDWPLGENPAERIEPYGTQSPFEPWPDWMVKALDKAPPNVVTATTLILCTGQRPNAAISMRWDDFNGEWMDVLDEKRGEKRTVYCPTDLREFLDATPKRGAHILAKTLTEPLGYGAIEWAFRRWRKDLGPRAAPYSLHGLRKLSIMRLAEAGCSDAEIQAVTGQSMAMIAYYRERANKLRLSKQAQERRK